MELRPTSLEVELFDALYAFIYEASAEPLYGIGLPSGLLEKAKTAQNLFSQTYVQWLAQRKISQDLPRHLET